MCYTICIFGLFLSISTMEGGYEISRAMSGKEKIPMFDTKRNAEDISLTKARKVGQQEVGELTEALEEEPKPYVDYDLLAQDEQEADEDDAEEQKAA